MSILISFSRRLVLSSPLLMTSTNNSRTNSGHVSLRSIDSHLTPISQSFQKYQNIGPNGSTFPNYSLPQNGHSKPQHHHANHQKNPVQVMTVWNTASPKPQYFYPQNNEKPSNLPPLKRTPPVPQQNNYVHASKNAASKWYV